MSVEKIYIKNFFDPSLFWFIYEKDLDAKDEFHRALQRNMRKKSTGLHDQPVLNEIVGIYHKNEWHRVQIKKIMNLNKKSIKLVHFIDEGHFERVEHVYTLPRLQVVTPPFCKKGMLYGVQQVRLEYDLQKTNVNHVKEWSDGIILKIQDILADPETVVKFEQVLSVENTQIGNVYIENPDNKIKGFLGDYLVEKGCAIIDKNVFQFDLPNKLSEDITLQKIILFYNYNQKRQRSKSISYQKFINSEVSQKRSTSETRKITHRVVQHERKLILQKAGIQITRQSRRAKFLNDMKRIVDENAGVEIPSQKTSCGSLKYQNDISSSEIESSKMENSETSFSKIIRGRGSKKMDTSSESSPDKPRYPIKLKLCLKKLEPQPIHEIEEKKPISSRAAKIKALLSKKKDSSFESFSPSKGLEEVIDSPSPQGKKYGGRGRKINYDLSFNYSDTLEKSHKLSVSQNSLPNFDNFNISETQNTSESFENQNFSYFSRGRGQKLKSSTPIIENEPNFPKSHKERKLTFPAPDIDFGDKILDTAEKLNISIAKPLIDSSVKRFSIAKGRGYRKTSSVISDSDLETKIGSQYGSVDPKTNNTQIQNEDLLPFEQFSTCKGRGYRKTSSVTSESDFKVKSHTHDMETGSKRNLDEKTPNEEPFELFSSEKGHGKKMSPNPNGFVLETEFGAQVHSEALFSTGKGRGKKFDLENKFGVDRKKIGDEIIDESCFDDKISDKSSICTTSTEKKSIFEGLTGTKKKVNTFRPAGMLLNQTSGDESNEKVFGRMKKIWGSTRGNNSDFSDNNSFERREKYDGSCSNVSSTSQSDGAKNGLGNFKFDENVEKQKDNKTPSCVMSRLKTKHCLCDKCTLWHDTNDLVWGENSVTTESNKKSKVRRTKRPMSPLLQNDPIKKEPIQSQCRNNINNFMAPKVLVHCQMTLQPVNRISESTFHPAIINSMKHLNYEKSHRIQAYSWCAIARGFHTVIINGPKSGKSMSYIPPMCSEILFTEHPTPIENGPQIIVIVPGTKIGEEITTLMCNMYYSSQIKSKVVFAAPPLTKTTRNQIVTGVDILVATPIMLLNLLKDKETRLKRIKAVVFEAVDTLLKNFPEEIESVMQLLNAMSEKNYLTDAIKVVFVGEHWSPPLEKLLKRLKRPPAICIGAHLEAALYGRININVKFVDSDNKDAFIMSLIEKDKKTVIICNTIKEIHTLKATLSVYNPLYLDETCDINEQNSVQSIWKTPSTYRVLICNDTVLNTDIFVDLSDSSTVIQYSLPESWTMFSRRFAHFYKNHSSPFYIIGDGNEFRMHICLDENSNFQYEKMVKFLQRFNENLPNEIIELNNKIRFEKEREKIVKNVELCENVKLFGECIESESCSLRHSLDDRDILNNLPKSGIVKLKILHMHDVTRFSVRLIQHIDSDNISHNIKDRFTEVQFKLAKLCNEEMRRNVLDVSVGTVCAIMESAKIFWRVKVTQILTTTTTNVPAKVSVKLLDKGAHQIVKTNDLLALPSLDLYSIPPQAIDVYLADMGPPDRDTHWSDLARYQLLNILKKADYEGPNCYFTSRIKLQLGNTLWVNNLILREYSPDGSLKVHKLSAQPIFLRNNLAEMRPGTIDKLYKLCGEAGIDLPDYSLPIIRPVKEVLPQVAPNWAHLENGQEYNSVFFCAADNLQRVFFRLCKYQTNFDQLMDDIQKAIRQPLYPTDFEVMEGRCYLGKDPQGDQYGRVLVHRLENDIAHCFFVDHGDYLEVNKADLKFLTDELIIRLPFQVIECSLHNLKPNLNSSERILDTLYNFAYEPDSEDLLRFLYVKIVAKKTAEVSNGTKYSILLIDSFQDNQIINNFFVENDLAEKTMETTFDDLFDLDRLKEECLSKPDEVVSDDEYDDLKVQNINEMEKKADSDEEEIIEIDVGEVIKNDFMNQLKAETVENDSVGWDLNLEELDIVMSDLTKFFADGFKDYNTQPYISREVKSEMAIVPSRAFPVLEYSTPNVVWSQTETDINLKIKLTGVTKYDSFITRNKIFLFSTSLNDIFYKLNITLFDKVESTFESDARGLYVLIKMKKQAIGNWERLVSGKQKLRHITYDPDVIDAEKCKIEEKVHIPFLFDEKDKPKFVYEYGSDVDYDESDANSYNSDS